MFSRSTAPAHCASGRDSMGRHCRCCPISSSAWAGVSWPMGPAGTGVCSVLFLVGIGAAVGIVLCLEDPDLLVETVGDRLQLVDGRVVFLNLHLLRAIHVGFLLRGRL